MPTYLIATLAYLGATLGCVFAPTAEVLVLFRALQGAGGEARGCCVTFHTRSRKQQCQKHRTYSGVLGMSCDVSCGGLGAGDRQS